MRPMKHCGFFLTALLLASGAEAQATAPARPSTLAAAPVQAPQRGAAQRSEIYRVKDYRISIAKIQRTKEWKDPAFGGLASIRAAEGEEILLVTLRIQAAGRLELKRLSAVTPDGTSYLCVFMEISESPAAAGRKPSTVPFERVLPFVVPVGTDFAKLVLEGVDVPVRSMGGRR